ncbi:hypothetical protein [Lysobacter enzymogenes]|uniref:hypothetical protein n=1 Tax=Lysobacter enzymogenes TaxID=69 RepID=UPI00111462D2|nr:hypothetical protein [Lysobacter enzymogenes]
MEDGAKNSAVRRIDALVRAGYKVEPCTVEALNFVHPAHREFKHARLMMLDDGLIVGGLIDDKHELRILAADEEKFSAFLRSIPRPTSWQIHRDKFYFVVAWTIGIGFWSVIVIMWKAAIDK